MTIDEVNANYGVPLEALKEYESCGLGDTAKKEINKWEYDDWNIELLGMVMTLCDIGFDNDIVEVYIQLFLEGKPIKNQRLAMLHQEKAEILEEVHLKEAKRSWLGYLRYELQPTHGKTKTEMR